MHANRSKECAPLLVAFALAFACPAFAQSQGDTASPSPVLRPKGTWQTPGPIEPPKGPWQTPGPIQQPMGPWQTPGAIQVPKGIQAVSSNDKQCERRISVVADALFDFDKSDLRADAVETLEAVGPEVIKAGKHPMVVEGFTDAIGTDAYNLRLSEQRAHTVRDWLVRRGLIAIDTPTKGYGKSRPIAPNQTPDGRDNPEGRQKNRRVEIVVNTCA